GGVRGGGGDGRRQAGPRRAGGRLRDRRFDRRGRGGSRAFAGVLPGRGGGADRPRARSAQVMSVELNHRINGPYDAPVVVFSNSLGASLDMWAPQVPALSIPFRMLRYDQRGHGDSPVPPG